MAGMGGKLPLTGGFVDADMLDVEAFEEVRQLELQLLEGRVRRSERRLTEILASDFVEFGSSGKLWDRDQIVRNLQKEEPVRRELDGFEARELAADVVLSTYRVRRFANDGRVAAISLRSSIWVRRDGRWQMVFHQGTRVSVTP
jgi:hypothetical protein